MRTEDCTHDAIGSVASLMTLSDAISERVVLSQAAQRLAKLQGNNNQERFHAGRSNALLEIARALGVKVDLDSACERVHLRLKYLEDKADAAEHHYPLVLARKEEQARNERVGRIFRERTGVREREEL